MVWLSVLRAAWIVSIHALAKSATAHRNVIEYGLLVSIHALAKSATDFIPFKINELALFQSTRSRRARLAAAHFRKACQMFQSTRSRRARPARYQKAFGRNAFQSTRSRRARLQPINREGRENACFNPRAREERDSNDNAGMHIDRVSIHALAKSATGKP